jgi:predicted ABC-type transport system involved in lysophospholipase L1 biosynthesis ATPase subunit
MNTHKFTRGNTHLSQSSVLDATAQGLALVQGSMTSIDTADLLGWGKSTVANVRERKNGLTLHSFMLAANATNGEFAKPLLAMLGKTLADIDAPAATADTTKLAPIARAVAMVAECTAPDSEGGGTICERELIANAAAIEDLATVASELMAALDAARRLRVAS